MAFHVEHPQIETLSGRLFYVRKSVLRMGRADLSAALRERSVSGSSEMSIRRYEEGDRDPAFEYVSALADLSGVPADWMFGRGVGGEAMDVRLRDARMRIQGEIGAELARGLDVQLAFEAVDARYAARRAAGDIDPVTWECWLAVRDGAILAGAYKPPPPDEGQARRPGRKTA